MANLTTKELTALSDQLNFEKDPLLQVSGGSSGVHRGRSEALLSAVCRSAPAEL